MGLFGRKKKQDASEAEPSQSVESEFSAPKPSRPRKRGKNDKLTSVLSETVLSAALADAAGAPRFALNYDFGDGAVPSHMFLALDVSTIGGLSKRTVNDEDKGSIIQSCKSNILKYFATSDMLDDDLMSFIPDPDTLSAMSEYSILANATYHPLLIADDAANLTVLIDGPDNVDVTFADARRVSDGTGRVEDLIGVPFASAPAHMGAAPSLDETLDSYAEDLDEPVDAEPEYMGADLSAPYDTTDADVAPVEPATDEFADIDDSFADGDELYPDVPLSDDGYGDIAIDEVMAAGEEISAQAQGSTFDREMPVGGFDVTEGSGVDTEPTAGIDANAAAELLATHFFKGSLALEVSADPFELQFGDGGALPLFEENRGDGWLNEGLSERSRIANIEMQRMRSANMALLRQRYLVMCQQLVDRVDKETSVARTSDSTFARDYRQLGVENDRSLANIDEAVEVRRERLESNYAMRANEVGEKAALAARATFHRQHDDEHKRELLDIEDEVRATIQGEYVRRVGELHDMRAEYAKAKFSEGQTMILQALMESWAEMYADETELYRQHRDAMMAWVDENRKDDIAYAEALREEQRQGEKSEQIRAEYLQKMQEQEQEFAVRRQALSEEIEDLKLRHDSWVSEVTAKHDAEVARLEERNAELQARYDELLDRYSSMDEAKRAEYEQRLQTSHDELEAERERYQMLNKTNQRNWIGWIAFAVVAMVAALCVGMILGLHQNIDYTSGRAISDATGAIVLGDDFLRTVLYLLG